jgi:RNA polymerase sigma-70 factor, ECF subfamily
MHYFDGLNIDAIAAVYQVHRATIARWLASTRAALVIKLRERLSSSLQASSSDFRSLVAALGPELHISVDRLLVAEGAGPGQGSAP